MIKRMICVVLATAAVPAPAAEDTVQRAQRCASIGDSLERLVCYDRIFAAGQGGGSAGNTSAAPVRPVAPAASTSPVAPTPPAPATAPAAPASGAAVAQAPAPTPAPASSAPARSAEFGADQLRRGGKDEEEAPRTLTATVQELRETRPNVFRITLDNGQIWQQMDMDSLFHVQVGDTVEINRGRMGGYRMSRKTRGGSGWVRVNRLK